MRAKMSPVEIITVENILRTLELFNPSPSLHPPGSDEKLKNIIFSINIKFDRRGEGVVGGAVHIFPGL